MGPLLDGSGDGPRGNVGEPDTSGMVCERLCRMVGTLNLRPRRRRRIMFGSLIVKDFGCGERERARHRHSAARNESRLYARIVSAIALYLHDYREPLSSEVAPADRRKGGSATCLCRSHVDEEHLILGMIDHLGELAA